MKNYQTSLFQVLVVSMSLTGSVYALDLNAITVFSCNDSGAMDVVYYVNSGPIDNVWDLFLYQGDVFDPSMGDPSKINWLNNKDNNTINIPLAPGTYKYTFHAEYDIMVPLAAMNLFFDNDKQAAISFINYLMAN